MQHPERFAVHTLDLEPGAFHIGTQVVQDLLATPRNCHGDHVPDAVVSWQVIPDSAGQVQVEDAMGQIARFVAGRVPQYALLRAIAGHVSAEIQVVVSPAQGMRFGFRKLGQPYPLKLPPDPVAVRRR